MNARRRRLRDLQGFDFAVHGQVFEGVCLDLPHPLARQPELAADRLERGRVAVAVQPVAPLHDLALALRQLRDRAPQDVLLEAHRQLLLRRRLLGRDQLAERALVLGADRLVEARDRAGGLLHLAQLLQRPLRVLPDLLLGRLPPELRRQRPLGPRDPLLTVGDVHRDPDRPRLVRDAALDCLPDPPRRVRRELEPAPPVELLDRADEADDPLLDQVEQREPVPLVLLRDRDHQAEVGVDHPLLRLGVAALDPLSELDLLFLRQERPAPRLVQEELQRVRRRGREVAVHVRALVLALTPAVVGQLDVALLELLVEPSDLAVGQLVLGNELVEVRQVDAAFLFTAGDQRLDLLVRDLGHALPVPASASSNASLSAEYSTHSRASPSRPIGRVKTPSRRKPAFSATRWDATFPGKVTSSSRRTASSSNAHRMIRRSAPVATPRPRASAATQ